MNMMQVILSSRAFDAVVFAALIVFTVLSLEAFGAWIERGADSARARIVALLLATAFAAMALGGTANYAIVGKPDFLNLAFFLSGAAGLGILPGLMLQRDKDKEMRRIAAQDL